MVLGPLFTSLPSQILLTCEQMLPNNIPFMCVHIEKFLRRSPVCGVDDGVLYRYYYYTSALTWKHTCLPFVHMNDAGISAIISSLPLILFITQIKILFDFSDLLEVQRLQPIVQNIFRLIWTIGIIAAVCCCPWWTEVLLLANQDSPSLA